MLLTVRRLRLLRAAGRGALAWLATLGYLVTVCGVPLPAPAADKPGGAFPCQHGRCGCATAAQCWSSCCCHTPRERMAWAKRHGVVPPIDLMALALEADLKLDAHGSADCCASESPSSDKEDGCHAQAKARTRSVVAIEALRCRGNSTLWVTSGAVTTPPPQFEHRVAALLVERLAPCDIRTTSPSYVPDDPPPRTC